MGKYIIYNEYSFLDKDNKLTSDPNYIVKFNKESEVPKEFYNDTSQKIGIDYFFEVITRQGKNHEFLFVLQNKGSEDVFEIILRDQN